MIIIATDLSGWISLILALFGAALAGWYTWKLVTGYWLLVEKWALGFRYYVAH